MERNLFIFCIVMGLLCVYQIAAEEPNSKSITSTAKPTTEAATSITSSTGTDATTTTLASKDKRQIGSKETRNYPNHRNVADDDPEQPQETIYGRNPTQFLIHPISPHHHQQHEEYQLPQLRNYQSTIRPQNQQLLEQSQEIQQIAYLQEISRGQPTSKVVPLTIQQLDKSRATPRKSSVQTQPRQLQYVNREGVEPQYVSSPSQTQLPHPRARQFIPDVPYQGQPQQSHPQQQQQYQEIPEEHFLKLIEEELEARAYHERQSQQQQQQQQQSQAAKQSPSIGLGGYRHRVEEPANFITYIPRPQSTIGPQYLPHSAQHQQQNQQQPDSVNPLQQHRASPPAQHQIAPQIAYYQPQLSYHKSIPNHPLAESSLEKEIEKLLAANKQSVQEFNSLAAASVNQPTPSTTSLQHHQHYNRSPQPPPAQLATKIYSSSTAATPLSSPTPSPGLLDANNNQFVPSIFHFSGFQPNPTYESSGGIQATKKTGPVIYPTEANQYIVEASTLKPKPQQLRSKQYGMRASILDSPKVQTKETRSQNKYTEPLTYDYERQLMNQNHRQQQQEQQRQQQERQRQQQEQQQRQQQEQQQQQRQQQEQQQQLQPLPVQFYYKEPSQYNPNPRMLLHSSRQQQSAQNYQQYSLPPPPPSQSTIYVSQSIGPAQSQSKSKQVKTIEDVKKLHLPAPGGKPLTQQEFQALIDAGYPVTAVPVPVPVPYDQFMKEHPQFRGLPLEFHQQGRHTQQQQQQLQQRTASSSPVSVAIINPAASESSNISSDGITYLHPLHQSRRHPRQETDVAVAGAEKPKKS